MIKFKRIVAFYIDNMIVSGVSMLIFLIISNFDLVGIFYYFNWYIIVGLILTSLKDIVFRNASIGKKLLGIKIEKDDGKLPSILILILRNIFAIIWPIDAILVLCTNKKIGDLIFKTRVVNVK